MSILSEETEMAAQVMPTCPPMAGMGLLPNDVFLFHDYLLAVCQKNRRIVFNIFCTRP